jgi:hypothetical protein
MLSVVTLSVVMLSVVVLNVVMLNVENNPFMLRVIILSVVMINVVMLSVVVPLKGEHRNELYSSRLHMCLKILDLNKSDHRHKHSSLLFYRINNICKNFYNTFPISPRVCTIKSFRAQK